MVLKYKSWSKLEKNESRKLHNVNVTQKTQRADSHA